MTVAVRPDSLDPAGRATGPLEPFHLLAAEHANLRKDLVRLAAALASADRNPALSATAVNLSRRLSRHLDLEESVVYPVCERLFGGQDGAAFLLRGEHIPLRVRAGSLTEHLQHDAGSGRLTAEALQLELEAHFGREERVLFPMASARLSEVERGALTDRLLGFRGH